MADEVSLTSKPQKQAAAHEEFSTSSKNQSKLSSQFLYKSAIVTVFLVLLPFFPSLAPEFINQTLHARSWELIQLIFVGIAVSYGLFSKKNDERENDIHNAQSYVSKILQVSSVFDDEPENPSSSTVIEENRIIQTSNSKYYRGEPLVLVAEETPLVGKDDNGTNVITSEISRKPLLLPVRSLKQRVPEREEVDLVDGLGGENGSVSRSGSKRFTTNSRKSRIGGLDVRKTEEDVEENLVLRSPIPWRSRSGRMEFREIGGSPNLDEQDFKKFESFRPNNSSSKNLSPSTSFSSDYSPAKSSEDVMRSKSFSSAPPPPPPPPPPPASLRKSVLMKSNSVSTKNEVSSDKVLRRSVRSVPPADEFSGDGLAKSVRTLRFNSELERNSVDYEPKYVEKMANGKVPTNESTPTYMKFPKKETSGLVEKVVVETSDEDSEAESDDDYFDQGNLLGNGEATGINKNNSLKNDVGPDVDKKADEFIAKFREQIRLQRIESIRRSTEQRAGKTFR